MQRASAFFTGMGPVSLSGMAIIIMGHSATQFPPAVQAFLSMVNRLIISPLLFILIKYLSNLLPGLRQAQIFSSILNWLTRRRGDTEERHKLSAFPAPPRDTVFYIPDHTSLFTFHSTP